MIKEFYYFFSRVIFCRRQKYPTVGKNRKKLKNLLKTFDIRKRRIYTCSIAKALIGKTPV